MRGRVLALRLAMQAAAVQGALCYKRTSRKELRIEGRGALEVQRAVYLGRRTLLCSALCKHRAIGGENIRRVLECFPNLSTN